MRALWTSYEIAAATGGDATGDFKATGVSIDSRSLSKGDLFVAIKGPKFDGHDFVSAAFASGASGAIVARRPLAKSAIGPLVMVPDTLRALNDLGARARNRTKAKILAVTGSVGKTSTKEMLREALTAFGSTFASTGNLNNQWGAPLSLARLPVDSAFGIFELGMNHAGEISPLSRLVRPDIAIITWVAAAHLEFFSSVAEIAEAKAEIFDGLTEGGAAILPRHSAHFELLAERAKAKQARIVSFGDHERADCRLLNYEPSGAGSEIAAQIMGRHVRYRLPAIGRHQAMNSLSVMAAIAALGLPVNQAATALSSFRPLPGRGKREVVAVTGGAIELIDESYNASPASMQAALALLGSIAVGGRPIAVLGDMRELGAAADDLHRALAGDVISSGARHVFLVGPHMRALHDALPATIARTHAIESDEMIAPLVAALRPGDIVLIKGSLGTRMAPLVDAVRGLGAIGLARRAGNGQ